MNQEKDKNRGISRRDMLAGLAAIPVLGAIGYGLWSHQNEKASKKVNGLPEMDFSAVAAVPALVDGPEIRVGVVGVGGRGGYLMKALGFVHPDRIDDWKLKGEKDVFWQHYLNDFLHQENLNVKITAVCDVFEKTRTEPS